jgi:25S rRNA (uracil2843-N3)-methyltransferase
MTHRSRTGGPSKKNKKQHEKGAPRKLHHPPSRPVPETAANPDADAQSDIEADTPALPPSVFMARPTDAEILQVIHKALRDTLDSPRYTASVQLVKSLLYEKKWLEVFGNEAHLESYAGRWVPSRALCYRELFASLRGIRELFSPPSRADEEDGDAGVNGGAEDTEEGEGSNDETSKANTDLEATSEHAESSTQARDQVNILSLGGGACSELFAVAAMVNATIAARSSVDDVKGKGKAKSTQWNWTGIDIGHWGSVVAKFEDALRTELDLDDDILGVAFQQGNLLNPPTPSQSTPAAVDTSRDVNGNAASEDRQIDISEILSSSQPRLITILFTLTELMSQDRQGTINLLNALSATASGTMLLVADSASDISEFEIGKSGRKWPVWMLLDFILQGMTESRGGNGDTTGDGGGDEEADVVPRKVWELMRKEDSRWYRLPEGTGSGWPVKLENTRYWLRLYRRR